MNSSEKRKLPGTVFRNIFIFFIKFYQKAFSPLFPPSCIYTPTCSSYAITALQKYGVFKGGLKALLRVFRCTPFHHGGFDPVK
jgi:putative membrane protein insertion efficiency factor